jgi:cytochrome P450
MTFPILMHHDEDVFENADEFKRNRFDVPVGDKLIEFHKGDRLTDNAVEVLGCKPNYCTGQ